MTIFLETTITAVGPDVPELLEGGVLVLFATGAPPELAEVCVLHSAGSTPTEEAPPVGSVLRFGPCATRITAIGARAWKKVAEIGHVVITFNGAPEANRPGEICAEATDPAALAEALVVGSSITIAST